MGISTDGYGQETCARKQNFGSHPYQCLLLLRQTLPVVYVRHHLPFFLISESLDSLMWPLAQLKSYIPRTGS